MLSNFALSLSHEGIRFLKRAPDGWLLVSETALDNPELPNELNKMLDAAVILDSSPIWSKLLIPNDQIKYMTLDDPQAGIDEIEAALEAETPYRASELAYDYSRDNDRTYVAAVAHDTLQEAEDFANEYRFSPLSFAAVPTAGTFIGEPFFGRSKLAETQNISAERETQAVAVIGIADLQTAVNEPEPQDEPSEPETDFSDISVPLAPPPAPPAEPADDVVLFETSAPKDGPKLPEFSAIAPTVSTVQSRISSIVPSDAPAAVVTPTIAAPVTPPEPVIAPKPPKPETKTADAASKVQVAIDDQRKKPRFLLLILMGLLIAFMAAVAVWASVADFDVSRLWGGSNDSDIVVTEVDLVDEDLPTETDEMLADLIEDVEMSEPDPVMDTLLAENGTLLPPTDLPTGQVMSPAEAQRLYAATGVWQKSPAFAYIPQPETSDSVTIAAIDPVTFGTDAVALPNIAAMQPDLSYISPLSPPTPGTEFQRDARGFIAATVEGTVLPSGVVVYAGRPSPVAPNRPFETEPEAQGTIPDGSTLTTSSGVALSSVRPTARPDGLAEQIERDALGGFTANELAGLRPRLRPAAVEESAAAAIQESVVIPQADVAAIAAAVASAAPRVPVENATPQAVEQSPVPPVRPRNFDRVVSRTDDANTVAPTARNAVVQPTGPVPNSVATAATDRNVISLRQVALIGISGSSSNRTAIVRFRNGSVQSVRVGDSLDGGQVTAISERSLNYSKRGRVITLDMP
ncbi:hypothetical protein BVC71_11540 [Marivivens niveibacter]|uniref:Type II secretion system protein GspC N-terminal domain-containing protein n=1 Tax=Marivivens niveibacter TaxID=1930667 RepID=A0A251WYE4_9RHOB|nr:hypothetical protein [Marivivens niveibacter]OUD09321.1 hypothetical protein BVC71_11540 [Marivivens niveibacter]